MPSRTLPTILNPSDLTDYLPTRRVMEYLYDEDELDEGEDPPAVSTIDDNDRAVKFARAAYRDVLSACQRGDVYLKRELIDLANDEYRSGPLVELVAALFWCKLLSRRRYVKGEPQAEEQTCKDAWAKLDLLRKGELIFPMEDVPVSSSAGVLTGEVYTNVMGEPTKMSTGLFRVQGCDRAKAFWGCVADCSTNASGTLVPTNGSSCGGCG